VSYPRVHITEECMREGMQIESASISIDDKVRLLDALSQTGLTTIMVGSFVSPKYTPQMAEIDELMRRFTPVEGVKYIALALNQKGRERAKEFSPPLSRASMPPVLFTHLSDTFVRRNANMTQAQEIERWPQIVEGTVKRGITEAGIAINAAFGSNFEGRFTLEQRMDLFERQAAAWEEAGVTVTTLLLGDPMGWCAPHTMEEQLRAARERWPAIRNYYLHLHDSRGLALATTYAALRVLDDRDELFIDTTIGGVGGCPYCGNGRATGMAATEDVVNLLHEMGIETGIDLDKLIEAVWLLEEIIGRQTTGKTSKSGPPPTDPADFYDPNLPFVETHEEARHFRLGAQVAEHQVRPWREPIPAPEVGAKA
jgi:hydroxymethylglutaryl-CoA lyase